MQLYSAARDDNVKMAWHHDSSRLFCDAATAKSGAIAIVSLTLAVTLLVFMIDALAAFDSK
jgi:hypothetical protein